MSKNSNSLWAPLNSQGYRRLFGGQLMSDLANWLDMLALSTLVVYSWGHGAWAVAALLLCTGLPWVVIGPPLSVRMNRRNGKHILIMCDLLRAAVMAAMLLAASLPMLLILVFLKMSISSVFDPVRQSAIKRLVDESQLAQASSLSQMVVNLTKVLGPVLGGAMIGLMDERLVFAACCALYLVSALILKGLPAWKANAAPESSYSNRNLRDAWRYIGSKPTLRQAVLFLTVAFFLMFLYDGLFVIFAHVAELSETGLGLLISSVGAGSVLGALVAGKYTGWRQQPVARMVKVEMYAGAMIVLVGIGGYGWIELPLWTWCLIFGGLGLTGSLGAVPFGYVLQKETTDDTIGPVSSLTNALQTGSMLVAPAIGAAVAEWIGVGGVFLGVGIVLSTFAALYLRIVILKQPNKSRPDERTANQQIAT